MLSVGKLVAVLVIGLFRLKVWDEMTENRGVFIRVSVHSLL